MRVITSSGSSYEVNYGRMRARKADGPWRSIVAADFAAGRLVVVWSDDDAATLTSKVVEVVRDDGSTQRFG